MLKQTRASDLALFLKLAHQKPPKTRDQVPITTLVPAFMISELKTAFEIGFLVYVPFLIIDLVISSTLMSMGMMMLPPVLISLPFKILLFVLVDGWALLTQSLVAGFHT
jgi:flagellar biosynthetic protein FliP